MIKLGTAPKAPRRLDLDGGAYILYRPMTTIDREAGLAAAGRAAQEIRAGADAAALYGLAPLSPLDGDADLATGFAQLVQHVEIGLRVIVGWEGVADADGAPAPVTRENLAALLSDPVYFLAFQTAIIAPILELHAEGNGFASSPNGAPAGASTIAQTAPVSDRPAPAASGAETASAAPSASRP
jgi:hypothetical protein